MKIIVTFEEMGGIAEFNGMPMIHAEQAIINKAAEFMVPHLVNEDYSINYRLTTIYYVTREVIFTFFKKD